MASAPLRRRAASDSALRATLRSRRELFYDEGADAALDRPAHVRSGSGLAWVGQGSEAQLVIAQDDASFLAVLDASLTRVRAITLDYVVEGRRQFDAGRGNKKQKLDLEACAVVRVDGREVLIAWGSGSLPPRERLVVLERDRAPRLVDARDLYAQLHERADFAGSELNLEGAVAIGDRVRLFQRGNGAPRDALQPLDATCDLDARALLAWLDDPARHAAPTPQDVVQWDLGRVRDVRLTFTDACVAPDGSIAFLAAAEASPDAIEDGEVVGVAIGRIDAHDARWTLVREPDGTPYAGKCEGLAWVPGLAGRRALVVVDRDDPKAPSELCEVDLEGFLWAP